MSCMYRLLWEQMVCCWRGDETRPLGCASAAEEMTGRDCEIVPGAYTTTIEHTAVQGVQFCDGNASHLFCCPLLPTPFGTPMCVLPVSMPRQCVKPCLLLTPGIHALTRCPPCSSGVTSAAV